MTESTRATRWIAGCALAGVSLIAAVVSYLHALAVVRSVGAVAPVSYLIPFLADLVILGASAALLDAARRRQGMPGLVVVSLIAGVGVTLAMNVAAGWHHGTAGALVAGWPAVAFILALESLAGMVRRGQAPAAVPRPARCPHTLPATASEPERIVAAFLHGRDCEGREPSFREVGRQVGAHHATVGKAVRAHLEAASPQTPAGAALPSPRHQAVPAGPALNGSHG
jgi:hypothetical protein